MTPAELRRAIESNQRLRQQQAREKAMYDYILADLIGSSIGRLYSKSTKMPELYKAYPSLFDKEEMEEKRKEQMAQLSALRFKRFVASYNTKYRGGGDN